MSMTKTDYEMVASVIKFTLETYQDNPESILTISILVDRLADELEFDNPKFNRNKFLNACGIEQE